MRCDARFEPASAAGCEDGEAPFDIGEDCCERLFEA